MTSESSVSLCGQSKLDVNFAIDVIDGFNMYKLPTSLEVLDVAKHYVEIQNKSCNDAIWLVSHKIYEHWVRRNVYPISYQFINKKQGKWSNHIKT